MKTCPHCKAELSDIEKELQTANARIKELEAQIEKAKEIITDEEADNIFD